MELPRQFRNFVSMDSHFPHWWKCATQCESQLLLDRARPRTQLLILYNAFENLVTTQQSCSWKRTFYMRSKYFQIAGKNTVLAPAILLDVKNAQATFESSVNRLVNARFEAKISETVYAVKWRSDPLIILQDWIEIRFSVNSTFQDENFHFKNFL